MRRSIRLIVLASLLSFGLGALYAAPANVSFFPLAYGQPQAPAVCSATVPLLDRDVGSLSAVRDGPRYLVAYQDRQSGGKGFVKEHVGGALIDVADTSALIAPAFQVDVVKVGSVALVPGRLYFTARKAGDVTGPYALWCKDF